jgi:DNA-binding PadR family transcriptional regulator
LNLPDKNPEGQHFLAVLFITLYSYSLLKALSDKGMEIDQSTLYPVVRRLESQGLLQSELHVLNRGNSPPK